MENINVAKRPTRAFDSEAEPKLNVASHSVLSFSIFFVTTVIASSDPQSSKL